MAFAREEKKNSEVLVSQALVLVHSHLAATITTYMSLCLRCTQDPYNRTVSTKSIALFMVAFWHNETGRRAESYAHTAHMKATKCMRFPL